jgi:HK97 family phage major capsid protein
MNEFLNVDAALDFGKFEYRSLLEGRAAILAELEKIGPNAQPEPAHEKRYDALLDRATQLDQHIAVVEKGERRSHALAALNGQPRTNSNGAPAPIPVRGPETEERDLLENLDSGKVKYSILRAVNLISRNKPLDGLEGEVSKEMEIRSGKAPQGFYLPWSLPIVESRQMPEFRAFDAATYGTTLIPKTMSMRMVDVLRKRMVMVPLGATVMADMVGEFDLPKKTGTTTAYWVGEAGEPTGTQPTMGQIAFTPSTVGAYTDITRRLMKQTSYDAEQVVRQDLTDVLRLELDRVGMNGSGSSNQPQGILQNSSVNLVEIGEDGGAATWAKIVAMESEVSADDADLGNLAYVFSARGRGHLKTVKKDAGSGKFIWDDGNLVNGYQAVATNQLPDNLSKGDGTNLSAGIFGNFGDAVYAFWGGIDAIVDTMTLSKSGGVRLVMLADATFKLRRNESFCKLVDLNTAAA